MCIGIRMAYMYREHIDWCTYCNWLRTQSIGHQSHDNHRPIVDLCLSAYRKHCNTNWFEPNNLQKKSFNFKWTICTLYAGCTGLHMNLFSWLDERICHRHIYFIRRVSVHDFSNEGHLETLTCTCSCYCCVKLIS